jgi:signal transduction histidine kinase
MELAVWGTDELERAVRGALPAATVRRVRTATDARGAVFVVRVGTEEAAEAARRAVPRVAWDPTAPGAAEALAEKVSLFEAGLREGLRRGVEIVELVAHDARNPIGAALTNLGFLAEGAAAWPEDARDALSDAEESVGRTRDVLDDGATLARLLAAPRPLAQPVDLSAIAAETARLVEGPAGARGLRLVVDPGRGVQARGDDALLRRAFFALAHEATRHAPRGGELRLAAGSVGPRAELRIEHALPTERAPRLTALLGAPNASRPALAFLLARAVAETQGGRFVARAEGALTLALDLPAS